MRGFNHGATFSQRGFNRPFLHDGFRGRHFHNHFRNGFRNNCFGFGCGYIIRGPTAPTILTGGGIRALRLTTMTTTKISLSLPR